MTISYRTNLAEDPAYWYEPSASAQAEDLNDVINRSDKLDNDEQALAYLIEAIEDLDLAATWYVSRVLEAQGAFASVQDSIGAIIDAALEDIDACRKADGYYE